MFYWWGTWHQGSDQSHVEGKRWRQDWGPAMADLKAVRADCNTSSWGKQKQTYSHAYNLYSAKLWNWERQSGWKIPIRFPTSISLVCLPSWCLSMLISNYYFFKPGFTVFPRYYLIILSTTHSLLRSPLKKLKPRKWHSPDLAQLQAGVSKGGAYGASRLVQPSQGCRQPGSSVSLGLLPSWILWKLADPSLFFLLFSSWILV